MGVISSKFLVNLYLVIPLIAIPETFLREMEGNAIFCDCWGTTPRSIVDVRYDRWRPPCQLMTSMFGSGVLEGVGGGVVCHILVLQLQVPRVHWDLLLLVESVVLPTDPPPGGQWGAAI